MRREKIDLLKGTIWKQILIFFFPVLLGTFFQQMYNTVDAIVVGQGVGKEALGAVGGSTGVFINLLIGFITGLSSGATVVISQYYGAGEPGRVSDAVKSGMWLGIVLGAAGTALGIWLAPEILTWMNVPADIYEYSLIYLRIYLAGLIPSMIYNTGAGIFRALGDSRHPLYFLIVSTMVNIGLDLLFVLAFHWGIRGVAWATVISQVVSCVMTLAALNARGECYQYRLRDTRYDRNMLGRIVSIGLPTGIQSVLYSVSNLFIQASVNSFGTDTVAAFTAFGKIDAVYWMMSGAYSVAVLTVVGQNFGAGNIPRVRRILWTALWMHMISSVIVIVPVYLFGDALMRIFTTDEEVIRIGIEILKFMSPTWITFSVIEIFSSGIRACGDSVGTMLITALGIAVFRIIWLSVVPITRVTDALMCYPASWIFTSVVLLIYYASGVWLKRSLKKKVA